MKKHSLTRQITSIVSLSGSRCNPALLGIEYDVAAALLHAQ